MRKLNKFVGILTIIYIFCSFFLAKDANAATTYHVSGSGKNLDGLTWSSAWNNINQIKGLTAGDTVYIAAGNYTGTYTFTASGSSGNPITIKRATISAHGSSTGWNDAYDGPVTITGGAGATIFTLDNKNNLVIDGVDKTKFILNGNSVASYGIFGSGLSTHSIVIQNITLHNFFRTAINFGLYGGFANNVEISNCDIYKNGSGASHEWDGGIIFSYSTAVGYGRNKVHDNYIHDGCITAELAACDLMTGNIMFTDIYNNHFNSGWTGNGGPNPSSSDMTHISGNENKIYNNIYETTGWNQNVFIHTENPAARIPTNNYIYNNLFYNPNPRGYGQLSIAAYTGGKIKNLYIYNNTFYGANWNVYMNVMGTATYENFVFENNIFWPNSSGDHRAINIGWNFYFSQFILDYNYYYTGDSPYVLYIGSGNLTVAGLQALGSEIHGGGGNPQLSSTANVNGFYLTSNSPFPLIGGGFDLSNIFNYDKNGKPRLPGKWDIGPYNNSTNGVQPVSPAPPSNLRLP